MKRTAYLIAIIAFCFTLCSCNNLIARFSEVIMTDKESSTTALVDGEKLYKSGGVADDVSIEFLNEKNEVVLDNADIDLVYAKSSDLNGYYVELCLTENGTTKFEKATRENVGKTISICIDGEVIMSPYVMAAVTDGRVIINSFEDCEALMEMFENLS